MTNISPELLGTMLDMAGIGLILGDASQPDHPLIYVNNGFLQLTGYTREEVLGRSSHLLRGERTDAAAIKQLEEAMQQRQAAKVDLVCYSKHGDAFWCHVLLMPFHDEQACAQCFMAIMRDISEEKLREEQLHEQHRLLSDHHIRMQKATAALAGKVNDTLKVILAGAVDSPDGRCAVTPDRIQAMLSAIAAVMTILETDSLQVLDYLRFAEENGTSSL